MRPFLAFDMAVPAGEGSVAVVRRSLPIHLLPLLGLMAACAVPADDPSMLSFDVDGEVAAGGLLIDVRGATERRRDGVSALPHRWLPLGPDAWRRPTAADDADFLNRLAADDPPRGRRLLVLCSVGVRSAAAVRTLRAAGRDARNIRDGWLGNADGPGLRLVEAMHDRSSRPFRPG